MPDRHLARFDLPAAICREIGRIIVRSGYIENYIQKIVYLLADVEEEVGRVAIREPRTRDRLDMILDLVAVRSLTLPPVDLQHLREVMDDADEFRNLCAHGAWAYSSRHNSWFVQVTKGNWHNRPKKDRAKSKKRISPEGQIIKAETFCHYVVNLDQIIFALKDFHENLEAQISSFPKKTP